MTGQLVLTTFPTKKIIIFKMRETFSKILMNTENYDMITNLLNLAKLLVSYYKMVRDTLMPMTEEGG